VYANQLRNWEGIFDDGGLANAKSDSQVEDQRIRVPVDSYLLSGLIPTMDDTAEEGFWAAVTGNGEKADEQVPAKVEQPLGAQEVILIPLDMIEELFGAIADMIKVG
jgi:hypothetical protein